MKSPLIRFPYRRKGIFLKRINRFLAVVDPITLPQKEIYVHIHDSGRLSDLLFPGNEVLIEKITGKERKTNWDILAAKEEKTWVLTNSGYHNKITENLIKNGYIPGISGKEKIITEPRIEGGRLDFLIGKDTWIEVKGCTLKKGEMALFPDAPTKRGQKHVKTLIELKEKGMRTIMVFLVLRSGVTCFSPNIEVDPDFFYLFLKALRKKVEIYPFLLFMKGDAMYYEKILPLCILP